MAGTTLRDSLVSGLTELYTSEHHQVRELPRLAKAASSKALRRALAGHLKETSHQLTRLEQVFMLLDERVRWSRCPGITGIIEECAEAVEDDVEGPLRDAVIIATAQRAEYYEMAAYGAAAAWAEALGLTDVARLLNECLDEEITAADTLMEVAKQDINKAAARANRRPVSVPASLIQRN